MASLIPEYIESDDYAAGYRKITYYLRDDISIVIHHKKVYCLCKELDVSRSQRKLLNRYPRKLAKKVDVTASNQL